AYKLDRDADRASGQRAEQRALRWADAAGGDRAGVVAGQSWHDLYLGPDPGAPAGLSARSAGGVGLLHAGGATVVLAVHERLGRPNDAADGHRSAAAAYARARLEQRALAEWRA